ncbi:hypothetical protein XELAEV_18022067mg [Xenopus laevis]|uniref:Uncharacterized protein n=1 Tax=Xenopus laevis TaxID=8355 RepID=A0A974HNC1_XENLA|nr:hypothetical protein XELAEV_18022067mg [Xenopus laevis]
MSAAEPEREPEEEPNVTTARHTRACCTCESCCRLGFDLSILTGCCADLQRCHSTGTPTRLPIPTAAASLCDFLNLCSLSVRHSQSPSVTPPPSQKPGMKKIATLLKNPFYPLTPLHTSSSPSELPAPSQK